MTSQTYRELITEGIQGLPDEALAEIADFIYFIRRRALQPQAFAEELKNVLLARDLRHLSRDETAHLEQEFADYDQLHPRQ